jgi:hypothetical protein
MAAHHVYTQSVTDYNSSIPMKYEQKILETIYWGVIDGEPKEDVRPKCQLPGIPAMPDSVFDEMYDAMVESCKEFKLSKFELIGLKLD